MTAHAQARSAPPLAPGFLSAEGAADYCGLSERTVWKLISAKRLPSHRVGKRVLIRVADLDSMITGQKETQ